ncbi:hypothetical protein L596_027238 [Steinernema carpocapsae]|uniref:Ephrin RBD domain-containing protein n=1 Tax=Steinernema carpocapsae TaxID=34508 RepID=A0A4U5M3W6_STECR|nr:hypothetical protein L596_027238 [Steinernema carpocapsae]
MASFLFFHVLLTLVAADDRLLHYSLSLAEPVSFKNSIRCHDTSVDYATNFISIVRCPQTATCIQLYYDHANGKGISQMGCTSNPMLRRKIKEVDCLERHPPVNTGWIYKFKNGGIYIYRPGPVYYAAFFCVGGSDLPLYPLFVKAMHLHALPPSLIPKDHPTAATSTTTTTTTTTSPVDDYSTTPVLPSTTEALTTTTKAVNDDVRYEYELLVQRRGGRGNPGIL